MPQSKEQIAAYMKEYSKEYREKNKEQIVVKKKEYREKNKERLVAYRKEYYENNIENIKEYNKRNKEQIAAQKKEYQEKNKEKIAAYRKEYNKINKEYIAAYDLKRRYGLLPEDYDAMLKEQNNKCKICLVEFSNVTPNIDHCHITNEVRGILCGLCNRGLGIFKDDIKVLTKAINYLEENNELTKQ